MISNSIFENDLFNNLDRTLNPDNIDKLRIIKTISKNNLNTVNNGLLEKIEVLKNVNNEYSLKAEAVLDRVIADQSLKVDVISGATTTSKALLKALENALNDN